MFVPPVLPFIFLFLLPLDSLSVVFNPLHQSSFKEDTWTDKQVNIKKQNWKREQELSGLGNGAGSWWQFSLGWSGKVTFKHMTFKQRPEKDQGVSHVDLGEDNSR